MASYLAANIERTVIPDKGQDAKDFMERF